MGRARNMAGMNRSTRLPFALAILAGAAALGVAFGSEWFAGLVPCALCLVERWPWRLAIGLGVVGLLLPRRLARWMLAAIALVTLAGAVEAAVHVGVEERWWPSPLPECASPRLVGGSAGSLLASMPDKPSKPCDDPTFLVPGVPVSMAAMNLVFALAVAGFMAMSAVGRKRN